MADLIRQEILSTFKAAREIALEHIPGNHGVRFDYDCRLYREGTIRDLLRVKETLGGRQARILDIGCGFGGISCALANMGYEVQGIDIEGTADYYGHFRITTQDFLEIWKDLEKRFPRVRLDLYRPLLLPFDDHSFDAILFYAALEHIPLEQVLLTLMESHRVLKPGGRLFVFRCPSERSWCEALCRAMSIPGHDLLYGEGRLKDVLAQAGYEIQEFGRSDIFPEFLPTRFQWLLDMHGFWMLPLQEKLLATPLRRWAHHFRIVAAKPWLDAYS